MHKKQEFLDIYKKYVVRDGADKLLEYLENSDFFNAPASARFHCAYEGGLCEHSVNVYHRLCDFMSREFVKENYNTEVTDDGIALIGLLHDICKVDLYKLYWRNQKDGNGVWQQVAGYEYADKLPYGHGEKSVYILSGFVKLTREEAFAVRYHMGFSGTEEKTTVGRAMEMFPLCIALSVADMEASFVMEGR